MCRLGTKMGQGENRKPRIVGYVPGRFRYIITNPTDDSQPREIGSEQVCDEEQLPSGGDCPVVFLPGLGGKAEHAWDMPNRQCIAVDYPGSGESVAEWGPISTSSVAEMVWDLLDDLEVDTCEIVGFSFGGSVAQKMVAQAPARVRMVTMVNATAGMWICGFPVTGFGVVGVAMAMLTLCSLFMGHRDMNTGWVLMHGFERMTEDEKRETLNIWEPSTATVPSALTNALMWFQRRMGDVFGLIAFLSHYLWPREIKILREFGASNRLHVLQAKDDVLMNPRVAKHMAPAFKTSLQYIDGSHMSITRPLNEVSDTLYSRYCQKSTTWNTEVKNN
eukprot:GEMP01061453.1.p1 GENE.GEMP01061453.1~~GEMP01061453.1.p1  ORF type:complete len:342 (+),score=41.74 GEMP01061453.1:29-1027(+)